MEAATAPNAIKPITRILMFPPLSEQESGVAAQVGESCPFPELSRGRWHGRRRLMLADGMMAIAKNGLRHVPLAATGKITLISGMRGRCQADVFVAAHESVLGPTPTSRSPLEMSVHWSEAAVLQRRAHGKV